MEFNTKLGSISEHRIGIRSKCRVLEEFVRALAVCNGFFLRRYPATPWLYESGVEYREATPDVLLDVPEILAQGHTDCASLSAWRIAELFSRGGVRARPVVTLEEMPGPGVFRFHVSVLVPGDVPKIEDPSTRLGMR